MRFQQADGALAASESRIRRTQTRSHSEDVSESGHVAAEGSVLSASNGNRGVGELVWILVSKRNARGQPPPYESDVDRGGAS
ncbi:hypothetical protein BDV98DRAFT_599027 [Pterulicium gracile]|uniref:Uncharacterized protein n=1 Tax=Pterulicium gracile TaxID=1884261 RepID=A0A5C3Q1Y5_9AGAR|nr:hypothetical protein BDV98DRAFT_599027 [Pterula gracilis]